MNHNGMFEYAMLHEGSYFGDISLFFDEPSEYSYFVHPYNNKPI